jgi:PAS domain S-box-containing protein
MSAESKLDDRMEQLRRERAALRARLAEIDAEVGDGAALSPALEASIGRTLIDAAYESIVVLDADGRIVAMNGKALALRGRTIEEMRGLTFTEVRGALPDLAARLDACVRRVIERRVAVELDDIVGTGSDLSVTLVGTFRPLLDGDGALVGVLGEALDISALREAERALAGSEGQLRSILDEIDVGVISVSPDGQRLLYANPAFERMVGRPVAELGAAPPSIVPWLHPDDRERALTVRDQRFRGQDGALELRLLRPDGEVRWLRFHSHAVRGADGAIERVDTVVVDRTEQRRAEEGLASANADLARRVAEATAELQGTNAALSRAARAKDEFLANMSHELRTPLNGVLGLVEALQENVYGPLVDKQRAALVRIDQSGRHLLSLITDVLDLAKIGAGKETLEITQVTVGDACRASLALVEGAAHQKQIGVFVQMADGFATIAADERKLKQILVNLLGNAVKFTPEGGQVGIEVSVDRAREEACFVVWDRGIGIAVDDLPRLFQPFMQVESSLSR